MFKAYLCYFVTYWNLIICINLLHLNMHLLHYFTDDKKLKKPVDTPGVALGAAGVVAGAAGAAGAAYGILYCCCGCCCATPVCCPLAPNPHCGCAGACGMCVDGCGGIGSGNGLCVGVVCGGGVAVGVWPL